MTVAGEGLTHLGESTQHQSPEQHNQSPDTERGHTMVRLSTITNKVMEAEVTFAEETIAFGFRPGRFTPELADRFAAVAEKPDNATAEGDQEVAEVVALLEPLLAWVDVTDENDERIEPTADNMHRWPLLFLTALMGKITEGTEPGGSKG